MSNPKSCNTARRNAQKRAACKKAGVPVPRAGTSGSIVSGALSTPTLTEAQIQKIIYDVWRLLGYNRFQASHYTGRKLKSKL